MKSKEEKRYDRCEKKFIGVTDYLTEQIFNVLKGKVAVLNVKHTFPNVNLAVAYTEPQIDPDYPSEVIKKVKYIYAQKDCDGYITITALNYDKSDYSNEFICIESLLSILNVLLNNSDHVKFEEYEEETFCMRA